MTRHIPMPVPVRTKSRVPSDCCIGQPSLGSEYSRSDVPSNHLREPGWPQVHASDGALYNSMVWN